MHATGLLTQHACIPWLHSLRGYIMLCIHSPLYYQVQDCVTGATIVFGIYPLNVAMHLAHTKPSNCGCNIPCSYRFGFILCWH